MRARDFGLSTYMAHGPPETKQLPDRDFSGKNLGKPGL